MPASRTFLAARRGARPWKVPEGGRATFEPEGLYLGKGDNALQVAIAQSKSKPNVQDIRNLWERRQDKGASPLLLVITYADSSGPSAIACGPAGERPPITPPLQPGQLERIAVAALEEPNRHAAIRLLNVALPDVHSDLPGIRNNGMFATQELRAGVPLREDWDAATEASKALLTRHGKTLVESLGYTVEPRGTSASLLRTNETATAIAIFLEEGETPEAPSLRFNGLSPVSQAFAEADKDRLPWVVVTRGPEIRVYSTNPDVGVGRKGRSETFIGINLSLLPDDRAGYLSLLFGSQALQPGGSFEQVLERSKDFSAELGDRLRERVYVDVIPGLAEAIALRYEFDRDAPDADLDFVYQASLVLLFRLLFIAYAEDKDVLPYKRNGMYAHRALKALARELADRVNEGAEAFDEEATDLWQQIRSLFKAVNEGNKDWGVPPYDGGLFSNDQAVNESGFELDNIDALTNAELGPALAALLVDASDGGILGPVDFRSLSVREFGTIYEGLLESNLSLAATDLTIDKSGSYLPAKKGQHVYVEKGTVYLHNRSGARKSTGSYFTKPFAVEHLLDNALTPALDEHLERIAALLEAGSEADAAEAFFDFRCADIAMGSGHFLVAAVDRIEARLSSFLSEHPMPHVIKELDDLRAAALQHLGELGEGVDIEHAALLRRLVGRRCIYGVDINLIAVELARLAIWIHTFVPGLPLSFLDHNLVQGNSLTGIGTVEEAEAILDPAFDAHGGTVSLFHDQIVEWLDRAKAHLKRLATVAEASISEVKESRAEHIMAMHAVEPARNLFDLLVAARLGEAELVMELTDERVATNKSLSRAIELVQDELQAVHFPVAFPEVFLRRRPGFDCILGNPPWEKVMFKTDVFWTLRFPGLKGMSVAEMNRRIEQLRRSRPDLEKEEADERATNDTLRAVLLAGPYPELEAGHVDLYKAFGWRYLALGAPDGFIGVVLPRSMLSALGSAGWRSAILDVGDFRDITTLTNTGGWVFDDAEGRYTIALASIRLKQQSDQEMLHLNGPFSSSVQYVAGRDAGLSVSRRDFEAWTPNGVFPLLPRPQSGPAFSRMQAHPPLADEIHGWRFRPIQGDFNSTTGKEFMEFDASEDLWPVYAGKSLNIWNPDTGDYYAYADESVVVKELARQRQAGHGNRRSAFSELDAEVVRDPSTLGVFNPRISYRKIVRATDSRTVIAALVPPHVVTTTADPYLLRVSGDERDEAFLLGVMCSIPFDWLARRYVEINLDFHLLNAFPVPRVDRDDWRRLQVEQIAGRLAAIDGRFKNWARVVGVPVGGVAEGEERELMLAQLDAAVGLLYGMDASSIREVFESFHTTWDYSVRLDAVLAALSGWEEEA